MKFAFQSLAGVQMTESERVTNYLDKRWQDWQDSFHSLYYDWRTQPQICSFFYYYTPQFVALFLASPLTNTHASCM